MLGILLASHGGMAEGLLSSAKMFFGDDIEAIDTISLALDMPIDDFKETLIKKVDALDSGDGVLILADLLGGSPCNLATGISSDKVHVISGANLSMLVEVLGLRASGPIDYDDLVGVGREGIVHTNTIGDPASGQGDDFFG